MNNDISGGEVLVMCNLSKGVWEEGHTEGILHCIKALMETMSYPADQAMILLAVPEEERPNYQALLETP